MDSKNQNLDWIISAFRGAGKTCASAVRAVVMSGIGMKAADAGVGTTPTTAILAYTIYHL